MYFVYTHEKSVKLFSIPLTKVFGITRKEQNKSNVHAERHEHFNLNSFFASNCQIFSWKDKLKCLFLVF